LSIAQTLIYHIGGNRYCHNIGRQHKSNHVSYLVDLKWGLLVQKCLDPDCQKLESKADPVPLPKEINPLVKNDENGSSFYFFKSKFSFSLCFIFQLLFNLFI